MAKTKAKKSLPAEMPALGSQATVEYLSPEELGKLPVFAGLAKRNRLSIVPDSYRLIKLQKGASICRQGEYGSTAFYIPSQQDLECIGRQTNAITSEGTQLQIATALVSARTSPAPQPKSGWLGWLSGGQSRSGSRNESIARQGAIFEGETLGEASSGGYRPRSATVTMDRDWYVVEILRSLFVELQRDKVFSSHVDEVYRERVLASDLRQLSIFRGLSNEQFLGIRDRVELVRYEPGDIVFDQGDAPDGLYIVRSGLVQIVQSTFHITQSDLTACWSAFHASVIPYLGFSTQADEPEFADSEKESPPTDSALTAFVECFPEALRQQLASATGDLEKERGLCGAVAQAFRAISRTSRLLEAKACAPLLESAQYQEAIRPFLEQKVRSYSPFEVRIANRALFHELLPQVIPPAPPADASRVLNYVSPGDLFGEMGVIEQQPRSATCIAFDHVSGGGRKGVVDLIRVSSNLVREICEMLPAVSENLKVKIDSQVERDKKPTHENPVIASHRFEELGLIQGSKLMMIDLDRCTRCGDCVQACVNSHDDGFARLYLDGPRFDKYLIPSACRNCRDPVCMIGCPVGSIQRGENGEILIRDWCIGCEACARQCPYDSIQMHSTSLVSRDSPQWWAAPGAPEANARWRTARPHKGKWANHSAPFYSNLQTQSLLKQLPTETTPNEAKPLLLFRHTFKPAGGQVSANRKYVAVLASDTDASETVQVWLNGQALHVEPDKKNEYGADVSGALLRQGNNELAVSLAPPTSPGALILQFELFLVTDTMLDNKNQHAVVCDQCSSLTKAVGPACVYACPHEAAIRVNSLTEFPGSA